jgi:hypothetical protein
MNGTPPGCAGGRDPAKERLSVSHFTRIPTRLTQSEFLLAALRDLGYQPQVGELEARGFAGNRTRVEVKIAASSGYDIGFRATVEGYEVVADWWGVPGLTQQAFLDRLHQRYAYHAARAKLQEQGFHLVEEQTQADGRIHLVLRRMG